MKKSDVFTIPNLLSFLRLVLIPVYYPLLSSNQPAAMILVGISFLTDGLDGWIARHFHSVSAMGKLLDPIADKCTQGALFLWSIRKYPELTWLFLLFLCKEGLQAVMGALAYRNGRILSGALLAGKISTAGLFASFFLLLAIGEPSAALVRMLCFLDTVLLLSAFGAYFTAYCIPNREDSP